MTYSVTDEARQAAWHDDIADLRRLITHCEAAGSALRYHEAFMIGRRGHMRRTTLHTIVEARCETILEQLAAMTRAVSDAEMDGPES